MSSTHDVIAIILLITDIDFQQTHLKDKRALKATYWYMYVDATVKQVKVYSFFDPEMINCQHS